MHELARKNNGLPPALAQQIELTNAGVSTTLVGPGKKAMLRWKHRQSKLPTLAELHSDYQYVFRMLRSHDAIAVSIVTGVVSGGLEVLDFDDGSLYEPWSAAVQGIIVNLPVVLTPSGGYHVYYRCTTICGNEKIACDPSREKETLIETRGEGGYVIAPGPSLKVHPSGRAYSQQSGPPLTHAPVITPDERRNLWAVARKFDVRESSVEIAAVRRFKQLRSQFYGIMRQTSSTDEFIARFNRDADWNDILGQAGWLSRDGKHWTRSGKTDGTSAIVGTASDGTPVLTVFSTNAGELSPESGHATYSKFTAYAKLFHCGDRIAAIKELNPRTGK